MPASDFSWSPQRQPLCHGIKRKHSAFSQSAECEMDKEDGEQLASVKRKCITHTTDISLDMNNMFEINHNDEQSYDLNNFTDNNNSNTPNLNTVHCDQEMRQSFIPMGAPPQGYGANQLATVFVQQSKLTCTVISHNQSHTQPQGEMIMDLNDETYSTTQIDICRSEELSYTAMDSDYVPNPEQYQLNRGNNSFGAPIEHNSHTVKSYCRPHWDNQDLRPYISDYY
ncbi:uncharacterized protein LOC133191499 isoform X3 [Saccostrea echinata]|uniref:uncharacterized protein LOC133189716 isoform X3 n=1 Tax=Saccostrea echinata TaxID=191078 RepID=UPI002A80F8E3|nr:uncharacterized protein LOC133189716 isoform X3 [Saccostrea echinata]XP_061183234.1 uncharacterized protein LOC133191499 isoform X3 [Saccostrea echinata]